MKVLFAGESWSVLLTHTKGFDHVGLGRYYEAGGPLIDALTKSGHDVTYMPNHVAQLDFPFTLGELKTYDAVIFSDCGSNTMLLHPKMQFECVRMPNRLSVIKEYVENGGGFLMCGGYMSYAGYEGKARYSMTPIADILPVDILPYDDRIEAPNGIIPKIIDDTHPVLQGIDNSKWTDFLGYNKLTLKQDAALIATIDEDVFMAAREYGKGRTFTFASDCVPHWAPPEFNQWDGYALLFSNIVRWLAGEL